jgi:hypothetical protein
MTMQYGWFNSRLDGLRGLRGEPCRSGFTSTDIDVLLAAQGFNCHEHQRTPKLLQRYAPAHVSRPAGNDWQTITTAPRI